MKTAIENGTVVNREGRCRANVVMEDGRIAYVGPSRVPADRVLDAAGCYVMAGFIDPHTHLELSPHPFGPDTEAALLGGTTCVLEFANQQAGRPMAEALAAWRAMAAGSACHYGIHMSVPWWDEGQAAQLAEMAAAGVTSFKMYMVYDGLRVDDGAIYCAAKAAAAAGGLLSVHCENWDVLRRRTEELARAGVLGPEGHPRSRPAPVEAEAVGRFLRIAQLAGAPAYVVHLSCRESLEEVRRARARGQEVYVETCPQYLMLDERRYGEAQGARYVMSPPLREPADCEALWQALARGEIDTVGTDHCSFSLAEKLAHSEDFRQIPNGCAGLQHRAQLLYTYGVAAGRLTLEQMAACLSANPAELFGLGDRGAVRPGLAADLVVWEPGWEGVLTDNNHRHDCDHSIYAGFRVRGRAREVFLDGAPVVERGALCRTGGGRYLPRRPAGRYRR